MGLLDSLFGGKDETRVEEVNDEDEYEFRETDTLAWGFAEVHGDYLVVPRLEEKETGHPTLKATRPGEQLVVPIVATLPREADPEESLRERVENPSGEGIEVNTTEHKFDLTD